MNRVFIATSLDGYIATSDHGLDWLESLPNPDGNDYGYAAFMETIDAVVMGRGTFEVIEGFRPWPYPGPVLVASSSLTDVPEDLDGLVTIVSGTPEAIVERCAEAGYDKPLHRRRSSGDRVLGGWSDRRTHHLTHSRRAR